MENDMTTIQLTRTARDRLAAISHKDESFCAVVVKLLDFYEDNRIDQIITEKSQ